MATPEEAQPAPEEEQPPARVAAAQSMIDDAEALLTALAPAGAEPAQKDPFDTSAPMNSVMAVAEALLDKYDDQHRVAAERFMQEDERTLAGCRRQRERKAAALEEEKEQLDGSEERQGRMAQGLAQLDEMIAELEQKIEGGLESYGYHPTDVAVENAARKAHEMAERQRIRHRRATAPKWGWKKQEERDSMLKGSFDGRTIAFDGSETAAERLDRLLGVATQLEHPGIDRDGIATMKDYIRSGRFDEAHYINIWAGRLEEMGCLIEKLYPLPAPEPEPEPEPESEAEAEAGPEPEPEPEQQPEQDAGPAGGGAVDMTVVFADSHSDAEQLDILLAKATELEHPGIDPEGIETMKGFIEAGRFPHAHYIKMWAKRLEDMGVKIQRGGAAPSAAAAPEGPESPEQAGEQGEAASPPAVEESEELSVAAASPTQPGAAAPEMEVGDVSPIAGAIDASASVAAQVNETPMRAQARQMADELDNVLGRQQPSGEG